MIYLDNSATSFPKPQSVIYAADKALREYSANPGRSGHKMSMRTAEAIFHSRERIASFFHLSKEENVIFTPSCTYALNTVIKGLLSQGDHVIISSLEHNSVLRPLERLKNRGIITYSVADVFPCDNERTIDSFRECINEKTRMIVCTHASNVFGIRLPVERICALAHQYGVLFCLDAAQSGGVLNVDIRDAGFDFVCCAGHKGLMGLMGSGLLLINNSTILDPLTEGGTGSESWNLSQPQFYPDRLESGTQNIPGILALSAGIGFIDKIGREHLYSKELRHIQMIYNSFKENENIQLYTEFPDEQHFAPVLSFSVKDKDSESVSKYLDRYYSIATRSGLHCAPLAHQMMGTTERGTVRVSPSYFTTENEIKTLINAVHKFSKLP